MFFANKRDCKLRGWTFEKDNDAVASDSSFSEIPFRDTDIISQL